MDVPEVRAVSPPQSPKSSIQTLADLDISADVVFLVDQSESISEGKHTPHAPFSVLFCTCVFFVLNILYT